VENFPHNESNLTNKTPRNGKKGQKRMLLHCIASPAFTAQIEITLNDGET